jgi:hypothetical protein
MTLHGMPRLGACRSWRRVGHDVGPRARDGDAVHGAVPRTVLLLLLLLPRSIVG